MFPDSPHRKHALGQGMAPKPRALAGSIGGFGGFGYWVHEKTHGGFSLANVPGGAGYSVGAYLVQPFAINSRAKGGSHKLPPLWALRRFPCLTPGRQLSRYPRAQVTRTGRNSPTSHKRHTKVIGYRRPPYPTGGQVIFYPLKRMPFPRRAALLCEHFRKLSAKI